MARSPAWGRRSSAFGYEWGFQHGSLLAYEIELLRERDGAGDPWTLVDAVMSDPAKLGGPVAKLLTEGLRKGWKRLADERRALLKLLSRCAVSKDQALRMYDATARAKAGIEAKDAELLRNPYLLFERDRRSADPIAHARSTGACSLMRRYESSSPCRNRAASKTPPTNGGCAHSSWVSWSARRPRGTHCSPGAGSSNGHGKHALQPPCPLGENVLDVCEESFAPGRRTCGNRLRASQPTNSTGSSSAAGSSAARCSAERRASRTLPSSTGGGAWMRG